MGDTLQILIAMVIYMAVVIILGVTFAKKANASSDAYFLGGRSLGPWVTAMSAEASDMSGWLLMGLPGVAYWCGIADAAWTAIGLGIGTYINWLIVSKRLRRYSEKAGNAITLPEYFSNRFHEKRKVIMTISAVFILVFFTVYAASCLVTCGKLFSTLFDLPYIPMMVVGAVFVLIYTIIGGFLAESASDFMQAMVMIVALGVIVCVGTASAGGLGAVIDNVKEIPGFLDFFGIATPQTVDGVQQTAGGAPLFGEAAAYGLLPVASALAWGLGYFGVPQVLLRFMAIRHEDELKRSRRIATVWVVISLSIAVFIGLVGRTLYPTALATSSEAENVFILLSTNLLPPLIAGFVMAGILAATISSSDSYLLIAASAFAKNIYQGLFRRKASDREVLNISRITLLLIAVVAIIIALDEKQCYFYNRKFCLGGIPEPRSAADALQLVLEEDHKSRAVAGMLGGAAMVFIWNLFVRPLGGMWDIYELLPAFVFSCLCIIIVSLLTAEPSEEIQREFAEVKEGR